MLVEKMVWGFKFHLADALSFFRLVAAIAIGFLVIFDQHYALALVLLGYAALSDACDGKAAARWSGFGKHWFGKSGKFWNDMPNGVLDNFVCFAIGLRLLLNAGSADWAASDVTSFVIWLVFCAVAGVLTVVLNNAKVKLVPASAENADVAQGWLHGAILWVFAFVMMTMGALSAYWFDLGLLVTIVTCLIAFDRIAFRDAERDSYTGDLTWREFLRHPFAK